VIRAHEDEYAIRRICRWLEVSPSGYYVWKKRPESTRTKANLRLIVEIRAIHTRMRRGYGSPRIHEELTELGLKCGRHRVARLMRTEGLRAKPKKRFRVTTQSQHDRPIATDHVGRKFTAKAPNRVWVSDITYIWTNEGGAVPGGDPRPVLAPGGRLVDG